MSWLQTLQVADVMAANTTGWSEALQQAILVTIGKLPLLPGESESISAQTQQVSHRLLNSKPSQVCKIITQHASRHLRVM